MQWKKYLGLVSTVALVGVVAAANGCSSSTTNNNPPGDGGGSDAIVHHDSGSSSGVQGDDTGTGDDSSPGSYDGTTGKACTSDTDCRPAGGPGINKCSADGLFQTGALYPSGVCLDVQNCDPGTDGNIHFCDGPDDPSSPGVCLPLQTAGMGVCLPQCAFKTDGSAATGCVGKDACNTYGFQADPSNPNAAVGIGYCFGGCETDADCGSGKCQTDSGLCVTALATGEGAIGSGCNQNATPAPTCNCLASSASGLGYCAQFCKVGGVACPSGQICDAELPISLTDTNDASIPGWTTANPGMAGFCAPTCDVDAGTVGDGGSCYSNSTCQAGDLGGPDCLP